MSRVFFFREGSKTCAPHRIWLIPSAAWQYWLDLVNLWFVLFDGSEFDRKTNKQKLPWLFWLPRKCRVSSCLFKVKILLPFFKNCFLLFLLRGFVVAFIICGFPPAIFLTPRGVSAVDKQLTSCTSPVFVYLFLVDFFRRFFSFSFWLVFQPIL